MAQFIKEHDEKYPPANKKRLAKLLKSVVSGNCEVKAGNIAEGFSRELNRYSNSLV